MTLRTPETLIDPLARGKTSKAADSKKLFGSASSVMLPVPREIWLDGDTLIYTTEETDSHRRADVMDTLREFVKLDVDGSPPDQNRVLAFAKKWGVFGICEHLQPAIHSGGCSPIPVFFNGKDCYAEPLDFWRRMIPKIAALSRLGLAIATGRRGKKGDWGVVLDPREAMPELPPTPEQEAKDKRNRIPRKTDACERLTWEIQAMIDTASLRPQISWNRKERRFAVEHGTPMSLWPLFGWLTLRLMTETCHEKEGVYAICPYCQNEYLRERRAKKNALHACTRDECQKAKAREYKHRGKG
jgi:hypothetical protein